MLSIKGVSLYLTNSFNSIARFIARLCKNNRENIDQLREKKKRVEASLVVTFRRLIFSSLFLRLIFSALFLRNLFYSPIRQNKSAQNLSKDRYQLVGWLVRSFFRSFARQLVRVCLFVCFVSLLVSQFVSYIFVDKLRKIQHEFTINSSNQIERGLRIKFDNAPL